MALTVAAASTSRESAGAGCGVGTSLTGEGKYGETAGRPKLLWISMRMA